MSIVALTGDLWSLSIAKFFTSLKFASLKMLSCMESSSSTGEVLAAREVAVF
jgi:hypothetical protein